MNQLTSCVKPNMMFLLLFSTLACFPVSNTYITWPSRHLLLVCIQGYALHVLLLLLVLTNSTKIYSSNSDCDDSWWGWIEFDNALAAAVSSDDSSINTFFAVVGNGSCHLLLLQCCCSLLSFWLLWSTRAPNACHCIITKLFKHLSLNLHGSLWLNGAFLYPC